jgi:hypothetical protein
MLMTRLIASFESATFQYMQGAYDESMYPKFRVPFN